MFHDIEEINENLPDEVAFSLSKGLCRNGQYIGSFAPYVEQRIEEIGEGGILQFAEIICYFKDGSKSAVCRVPLSNLHKMDWLSIDQRCIIDPDCVRAGAYLSNIVHHAILLAPLKKEYRIQRLGLHEIEGKPVFFVGNSLIQSSMDDENIGCVFEKLPFVLEVDYERYPEGQAIIEILKIINVAPSVGRVLFSHLLLNVMRKAFIDANMPPACVVFLFGKSGFGKTSYAGFITKLYNRSEEFQSYIRLNSTQAATEKILFEKADCSVLLDDLFPAQSQETRNNQEKLLIDILRVVGDNSGRQRMMGKKAEAEQPRCGLVITGEYLIGNGSDAARMLPIELTSEINFIKLSACEGEPLALSTFFGYFIQWYVDEYLNIVELLKRWRDEARRNKLGVHARLESTYLWLTAAYKIFLTFCVEKDYVSKDNVRKEYEHFKQLILGLVFKQDERVKQDSLSEMKDADYFKILSDLHKSGQFRLAKSEDKFDDYEHDGFIKKECLWLRGKQMTNCVTKYISNATQTDIVSYLSAKNVLVEGCDRYGKQSSKLRGKRFYVIPLKKL